MATHSISIIFADEIIRHSPFKGSMASHKKTLEERMISVVVEHKAPGGELETHSKYLLSVVEEAMASNQTDQLKLMGEIVADYKQEKDKMETKINYWRATAEARENELTVLRKEVSECKDKNAKDRLQNDALKEKLKNTEAKLEDLHRQFEERGGIMHEDREAHKRFIKLADGFIRNLDVKWKQCRSEFNEKNERQLAVGPSLGAIPGSRMIQEKMSGDDRVEGRKRKEVSNDGDSTGPKEPADRKQRQSSTPPNKRHKKPEGNAEGGGVDLNTAETSGMNDAEIAGTPRKHPPKRNVSNEFLSTLVS